MVRSRTHKRASAQSHPRGQLSVARRGYGFVETAEGEFFIPRSKMNGAFDGDTVEVIPLPKKSSKRWQKGGTRAQGTTGSTKRVARVSRVVERAHETLVGRYEVAEPFGVVVPINPHINHDIFTRRADAPDVPDGSFVRVRIQTFPTRTTAATGFVEEVLGEEGDERISIDLIVAQHKLETKFSDATLAAAREAALDEEGALASGYRDLRDRFVFTVDPVDARDFDDALSFERVQPTEGQKKRSHASWRLGVHIADVAHYVKWGSSIDLDARRRATSVYLVDRVIPMLPDELSSNLCSLRPGEVRRSITVDLYVDDQARLVDFEIYPALIRSSVRLDYETVQTLYEKCAKGSGSDTRGALSRDLEDTLTDRIQGLVHFAHARAAAREQAGGLDFEKPEAHVRLDEQGRPVEIQLRRKTDATSLIEEAMILANETVAQFLRDADFPCVYRVHDKPSREDLSALVAVLGEYAWFKKVDKKLFVAGNSCEVARVIKLARGRPESTLVSMLVLRAMKRAVYSPVCTPHYGLASMTYAHFTSPIRRYPDLVVHRMVKAKLGTQSKTFKQEVSSLGWLAEHSSAMERVADRAAFESQEVKIIEFMESHIGETFTATVTGVATYGIFVQLENTAEGMVSTACLGDEPFALDEKRHTLTGRVSNKVFTLGKRVAVVLIAADHKNGQLDFRLKNPTTSSGSYSKSRGRKGRKRR